MNGVVLKNKRKIRVVVVGVEGQHGGFFVEGEVISGELDEGFGDLLGGEGDCFNGFVFFFWGEREGRKVINKKRKMREGRRKRKNLLRSLSSLLIFLRQRIKKRFFLHPCWGMRRQHLLSLLLRHQFP